MTGHPAPAHLRDPDALPAAERAELLAHVRSCRACRAVILAERPEALFGLLAQRPLPQEALDRLSRNVSAAIDALEPAAPTAPATGRTGRRFWAAGAVAASLVLGLLLGLPLVLQDGDTRIATATPPPLRPAAIERDTAVAPVPAMPVRGLELLSSPGEAEVVDFAIGDAQVVMIFDKELDI